MLDLLRGRMAGLPCGQGCRVVGRLRMPSEDANDNLAHPVVAGGRLYLRQGSRLLAYDLRR